MKVVNVNVWPRDNSGKLKAYVDIIFAVKEGGNGCLTIKGWKLFQKEDGDYFVSNPQEKIKDEWKDRIFINFKDDDGAALKDHITEEVVKAYIAQNANETSKVKSKPKAPF